jgi:Response regulator containing CheY-like receiver domain and AraC-type DNA-binding domain
MAGSRRKRKGIRGSLRFLFAWRRMMNKLKVLIADDERRIAMLIQKLIDWDANNLECAGLYDDGQKAYEAILSLSPEIVVTDIRMPIVDGLEMIRRLRESGHDGLRFVIVSGYKEFEYARQALQYGVEDYLLKPVNEKELNAILYRMTQSFDRKARQLEQSMIEEERRTELRRQEAVESLLSESWRGGLAAFNAEYGLGLADRRFAGFCLKFDRYASVEPDSRQDKLVTANATRILEGHFGSLAISQVYSSSADTSVIGILNFEPLREAEIARAFGEALSKVKDYAYAFSQYEATMAIGEPSDFAGIHDSLDAARAALAERLVIGSGRIIRPKDVHARIDPSALIDILDVARPSISNAIDARAPLDLLRVIDSVFRQMKERRGFGADSFLEAATSLVRLVYAQGSGASGERELVERLRSSWSLSALVELLKKGLCAELEEMQGADQAKECKPIRTAIAHIESHYSDRITLEEVASVVQLNSAYFSTLFKKETGENFLAYLTKYRIEKSKALLCETNETMASIANKVGYANTRYFSDCFEKVVGVKPSVYRKIYA